MELYRSPWEAYPFLSDDSADLRCDFELLTDEITSMTGLLAEKAPDFRQELLQAAQLIYHANPTLRTRWTVTDEETAWLLHRAEALSAEAKEKGLCDLFVLPQGSEAACLAHILRVKAKCLVRLIYRHAQQGRDVPHGLLDFANILSGYFFNLALILNDRAGAEEIPFVSRNYARQDG